MWDEKIESAAWKGFDWDTMNRFNMKKDIKDKGYYGVCIYILLNNLLTIL